MTWSSETLYVAQPVGVDLHLEHLQPLAPDRHVRDAGHAQQPGPDRPVRDHRHLDQGSGCEDRPIFMTRLVDDSGWIMNGGAAQVGSVGVTVSMRSDTSWRAPDQVGAGLEDQLDRRQLRHRLRAQGVEAGQPVEGLLQRHRHERLDLCRRTGRGTASGSPPAAARTPGTRPPASCCSWTNPSSIIPAPSADHEHPELQARTDDPTHHGRLSPASGCRRDQFRPVATSAPTPSSVPYSSAAPTVTTVGARRPDPATGTPGRPGPTSTVMAVPDVDERLRDWCRSTSRRSGRTGRRRRA